MGRHSQQEYAIASCWESSALNTRRENELFIGSVLVVNNHPKTPFYRAQHNTGLHHQKMGRFNSMLYRIHGLPKKKKLGFSSPILAHCMYGASLTLYKTSSDYLQPHIGTLGPS